MTAPSTGLPRLSAVARSSRLSQPPRDVSISPFNRRTVHGKLHRRLAEPRRALAALHRRHSLDRRFSVLRLARQSPGPASRPARQDAWCLRRSVVRARWRFLSRPEVPARAEGRAAQRESALVQVGGLCHLAVRDGAACHHLLVGRERISHRPYGAGSLCSRRDRNLRCLAGHRLGRLRCAVPVDSERVRARGDPLRANRCLGMGLRARLRRSRGLPSRRSADRDHHGVERLFPYHPRTTQDGGGDSSGARSGPTLRRRSASSAASTIPTSRCRCCSS